MTAAQTFLWVVLPYVTAVAMDRLPPELAKRSEEVVLRSLAGQSLAQSGLPDWVRPLPDAARCGCAATVASQVPPSASRSA